MNKLLLRLRLSSILILIVLMTGCAAHRPKTNPELDKKAFNLSIKAQSHNQEIVSSKGSGWALLETDEKTDRFKIAWAAIYPGKIRITFLLSGLPVETILATGKTITFLSHTGQHSKYSYPSKDPDMEKFVNVPVRMSEIILLLLGRFPIKPFDDAYFSRKNSITSNITLKTNNKNQTQYLVCDQKGNLQQFLITDFLGDTLYKIVVKEYKNLNARQIPAKIEITDNNNKKLTLHITDFKANPPIKEGIFQLTESG